MRILICGGCGYVGRHVTGLLSEVCTVYDNLTYVPNGFLDEVGFIRGDVTDYATLQPLLDRADVVVWLAAIVGDAAVMVNPDRAIAINQGAVRYLAEHYDGPVVFTSSASVYGIFDGIATVDSPLAPVSLYAETKVRAEEYLRKRGNVCILRMGTLHGVSKRMRFDLVVNGMTLGAFRNGVIRVYGGRQFRPLLSVKDAASVIASVTQDFSQAHDGTFNLTSENLSVHQIAEKVRVVVPWAEIQTMQSETEDKRNYQIEIDPRFPDLCHTVRDSAQDIVNLLASGRLHNPLSPIYSNVSTLGDKDGA